MHSRVPGQGEEIDDRATCQRSVTTTMKLINVDSPEVITSLGSTRALACWIWSPRTLVIFASLPSLVIAIAVGLLMSVQAAVWISIPVFLLSNVFLLWRGRSPRLNWVVAGCADKVFVRLFGKRGWNRSEPAGSEVLVLATSEIASMLIRTFDVFLDGSKPKVAQWLVIEPSNAVAEEILSQIPPLLLSDDPGKQPYVSSDGSSLTMKWRWCHPELRTFLNRLVRECASIVIGPEERSELDLNGIWAGFSRNAWKELNTQERQQLVLAGRLGFGLECEWLLSRYKCIALQESAAYLAEIAREETGTGKVGGPPRPGGCACR